MIVGAAAAGVAALILWGAALPLTLGAHPFWAAQVIWIGLGAALILHLATLRLRALRVAVAALVLTGVAYGTAFWGKTEFAASYAENALAGQAWYFGWMATCGLDLLAVAAAARHVFARRGS